MALAGKVVVVSLIVTGIALIALAATIEVEPWEFSPGTVVKFEIRELNVTNPGGLIRAIASEYIMNGSPVIYVRLESDIWTTDASEIAQGILTLRMPYNLSVSTDGKAFRNVTEYRLPVLLPPTLLRDVESALESLENVSVRAKHFAVADVVEWTIVYNLGGWKVSASYEWKKQGYLDSLKLVASANGTSEGLYIVCAGFSPAYRREYIARTAVALAGVLAMASAGLAFRLFRAKEMLAKMDRAAELKKALEGIERELSEYRDVWVRLTVFSGAIGFPMVYLSEEFGDAVILLGFLALLFCTGLLVAKAWRMTNIGRVELLAPEAPFYSPIAPAVAFAACFGLGLGAVILSKDALHLATLMILPAILALYAILRLFDPQREAERLREVLLSKLEELGREAQERGRVSDIP